MTTLRTPFAPGFGDNEADDLAAVLKALGDPSRLKILSLLKTHGPMTGMQFEAYLTLAQPTITHHLRVLDRAGLITTRKQGVFVWRELATAKVRELSRLLDPGRAK